MVTNSERVEAKVLWAFFLESCLLSLKDMLLALGFYFDT